MSFSIKDGNSGYSATVDSWNRLKVLSDSRSDAVKKNLQGQIFTFPISVTPTSGTSVFAWLGNAYMTAMEIIEIQATSATADSWGIFSATLPTSSLTGTITVGNIVSMNQMANIALPTGAYSVPFPATVNGVTAVAISGATTGAVQIGNLGILAHGQSVWKPQSRYYLNPGNALYLQTTVGGGAVLANVYFTVGNSALQTFT